MMERIPLDKNDGQLYDVVVVDIDTLKVQMMGEGKTAPNADAIKRMAIMRCANGNNFFATVPAGKYQDGSIWGDDETSEDDT